MHPTKRKELLHWWDMYVIPYSLFARAHSDASQLFGEGDDEPSGDSGPSPAQDLAAELRKQAEEIDRQQAAAAAAAAAASAPNTNP